MIYDLQAFLRVKVNVQLAFADTELWIYACTVLSGDSYMGFFEKNNGFEENNEKVFDDVLLYNKEVCNQ